MVFENRRISICVLIRVVGIGVNHVGTSDGDIISDFVDSAERRGNGGEENGEQRYSEGRHLD